MSSTIIVGGGIIGLAIGWRLAQAGDMVRIIERGRTGREASWAAAGMLCPFSESDVLAEAHNQTLANDSLALYELFVAELQKLSGDDVDFKRCGSLSVAVNHDQLQRTKHIQQLRQNRNMPADWLSPQQMLSREPMLSQQTQGGLYDQNEGYVDSRKLVKALHKAIIAAGGEIHEQTAVEALHFDGDKYRGVKTADGLLESTKLLLAAGCWTADIKGLPTGMSIPVRPVKGQMLALKSKTPLLGHVIRGDGCYIAPRSSGKIVCGSTSEEAGFNRQLTVWGVHGLLRNAVEILPAALELAIDELWTGLRPASRDETPIMGKLTNNVYVATGHYRNGILLAPITAQYMSNLMLGKETSYAAKLSPQRFWC